MLTYFASCSPGNGWKRLSNRHLHTRFTHFGNDNPSDAYLFCFAQKFFARAGRYARSVDVIIPANYFGMGGDECLSGDRDIGIRSQRNLHGRRIQPRHIDCRDPIKSGVYALAGSLNFKNPKSNPPSMKSRLIQIFSLPVFLLALASLAGCASSRIRPLAGTPPAPYVVVPHEFFYSADAGPVMNNVARSGRSLNTRSRNLEARSSSGSLRRSSVCVYNAAGATATSAAASAALNASITSMVNAPVVGSVHFLQGCQMPAGKYLPVGQDGMGYFYQAPAPVILDGQYSVTGGIYWRDGYSTVGGVYYLYKVYKGRGHPIVSYHREIAKEVIVPTAH